MPSPSFSLSITTGLDWLAGLANLDRDPASPRLPRPNAASLIHSKLCPADALLRRVGQPDDVVACGIGIPLSNHSASPSVKVFRTHGQETMEPFADAKILFAKSANN